MVNKINNSQTIDAEIKSVAYKFGMSPATFKRLAAIQYVKNLNMKTGETNLQSGSPAVLANEVSKSS